MIRQIRSLLYEQGYTIGGARQQMASESGGSVDEAPNSFLVKEIIGELEEVAQILS